MKNFDDIACIFCGAKNTKMHTCCVECASELDVAILSIGESVFGYELKEFKGRGFYGLTYRAEERYGRSAAVKIIPKVGYTRRNKNFDNEAKIFASLPDSPILAKYINAGECKISFAKNRLDCYYIVSEWIEGISLHYSIKEGSLLPEDVILAARDLLTALTDLNEKRLWHNDLHDENIIVSTLTEGQRKAFRRTSPHMFRIIDVGSMSYWDSYDAKKVNDFGNVAAHLAEISKSFLLNPELVAKEDIIFFTAVQELCAQLADEHPARAITSPSVALDRIEAAYATSRLDEAPERKTLDSPYDFPNAADITSPWLLREMFSERLGYVHQAMAHRQQAVLFTGPRGSGKTMLLKNLRFTTLYDSRLNSDHNTAVSFVAQAEQVGLFVSARRDFGNYLLSYRQVEWANNESTVLAYFNLLVCIELINVLYRLVKDVVLLEDSPNQVLDLISITFKCPIINLDTAKQELIRLSKRLVNDEHIEFSGLAATPAFLNDLFELCRTSLPTLRGKEFIILVDDLSLPKIPVAVQKALVPALFNPSASYKTRVTAHSDGLVLTDPSGATYDSTRDLSEMNLGAEYWKLSEDYNLCRECIDDILAKRYLLARKGDFAGIESLLGTGEELENVGREIIRLNKEDKIQTLRYHGARILVRLCSGDLAYVIEALKLMVSDISTPPVSIRKQHMVINEFARRELRRLKDINTQFVPSLYDVAYWFGVWSKSKLINEGGDYLRIELNVTDLSHELQSAERELLSSGVFVDGGNSRMQDGAIAKRLLFRRAFTPAFPTTVANRDTFRMSEALFERFVKDPKQTVKASIGKSKILPDVQQPMLDLWPHNTPNSTLRNDI